MDLSIKGDQPFTYSDDVRTIYIICNGEIYNHLELRKEFDELYEFKSNSDCEVLIPLYLKYGMDFIKMMDAEYAFAIFDFTRDIESGKIKKKLYLSRDHLGIRPLFYTIIENSIVFSSEMKGLQFENNVINICEPRTSMCFSYNNDNILIYNINEYYKIGENPTVIQNIDIINHNIRKLLIESVCNRLNSDQEIGALLSGGLDSSLICSIASQELLKRGKTLKTFCIGMAGSPDVEYSKKVAEFIKSDHTILEISQEEMLDAIDEVVYHIETYDITTIRASVGQYIVSKKIAQLTDIKVIIVGDVSDELTSGYLYFHNSPDAVSSHNENIRLLNNIHYFDILRTDRGIASHDLEARVPYGSRYFIDYYLSIDPELRVPKNGQEKWLLRNAFIGYLPDEVLFRRKEAFSDGISNQEKSWYVIIQEKISETMTDEYFNINKIKYQNTIIPHTKEALYYRELFEKFYKNQGHVLKEYWMPKWSNTTDPSARTLKIY
jgi:asparagine synthase (glutamine-hydrolysing)